MKEIFTFKKIALIFLAWTLFGVFFGLQNYVTVVYFGQKLTFTEILSVWLICGYAWMFLTPLVIYLAQRFFLQSGKVGRHVAIHFFFGSLLSILQLSLFILVRQLLLRGMDKPFSFTGDFQRLAIGEFHVALLIYWSVVGIWHLREINRRYLERERDTARLALETSQLETKLANARLEALKMQLQPHFLFNTLNSISVLMRDDVAMANKMLVRLSELLRAALRNENSQEVTLQEELEFLRGYLEIEQIRFQDRLTVDFQVEKETLDAKIPNLILQPLVENSIRHGIAPLATAGKILIESHRENGFIELSVSDNGAGLSDSAQTNNGIGWKNTRERLEKLYGEKQKFEVKAGENGGLQVKIKIPYHQQ